MTVVMIGLMPTDVAGHFQREGVVINCNNSCCIHICELLCTHVAIMWFYKNKLLVVVLFILRMFVVNRKRVQKLPINISVDSLPQHAIVGVVLTV